jgi:membrane-bound lytic murein transglycosylase D
MKIKKSGLIPITFLVLLAILSSCTQQKKVSLQPSQPKLPAVNETGTDQDQPQESLPDIEKSTEEDSQAEILEEALDAYQDAQIAWEKADIDTALAALDEAYSLLLKLDLDADSPHLQEKNDLRLLIAQRIQEIYASHLIAVGTNHREIPLTENKYVLAEITRFQTKERQYFIDAYRRSGMYTEMIRKKLKQAGMPEELLWIPVVESGFKVKAYSRARALGLWQFISSTGYRFGLKRNRWIDERMDPEKSTDAAIKYLKELHSIFGDWTTVLASYNCGEFRVQRIIRAQRINYLDNFWDLFVMLPRETARFVPRIIATLLIIKNPDKYGFMLPQPDSPVRFETVQVNRPVRLSSLSKLLKLQTNTLSFLNPELRHQATPDAEYNLKVPDDYRDQALTAFNSLSKWIPPEATYVLHYVRRGETVSGIARRYGTSVSAISRLNRLRRSFLIRAGQRLKIPTYRRSRRYTPPRELRLIKEGEKMVYVVKRGDSIQVIARAFNTTIKRIKELNNLQSNIIKVGQKLVIQPLKMEGAISYTVQSGDTPYSIAVKNGMDLRTLLRINGLRSRSKIYPGQQLWVIPKKSRQ